MHLIGALYYKTLEQHFSLGSSICNRLSSARQRVINVLQTRAADQHFWSPRKLVEVVSCYKETFQILQRDEWLHRDLAGCVYVTQYPEIYAISTHSPMNSHDNQTVNNKGLLLLCRTPSDFHSTDIQKRPQQSSFHNNNLKQTYDLCMTVTHCPHCPLFIFDECKEKE